MPETKQPYLCRLPLYVYVVLADTYGAVTLLLLILWLLTAEGIPFVRLFLNLLPPLLLPALIALPIGLLLRKWRPVLLVLPAGIAFVILYGYALLPKPVPTESANISVLTYNVYVRNTDYESVAAVIREADADVIAMQEMRPRMADFLVATFAGDYPYSVVNDTRTSRLLLSRLPLLDSQSQVPVYGVVEVAGQPVMIQDVHLPVPLVGWFSSDTRSQRLDEVLALAANRGMPQIIVGDFNMSDATGDYRRMTAVYTDVYRTVNSGFGITFPNWPAINPDLRGWPALIRLDYVFVSSDITPIQARVLQQGASDHFPLLAHLRVTAPD